MTKPKHILVAVDFNKSADPLLNFVAQDIRPEDQVTLLYILGQGYMGLNLAGGLRPFDKEATELNRLTMTHFGHHQQVSHQIGFDPYDAADGIVRYAERQGVDRIYLGSRDRHGLMDKLLGSTCLKVVNQAPCDVVVVPYGAEYSPADKLIMAVTEGASQALTPERLNEWGGKQLLFVHVAKSEGEEFKEEKKQLLQQLFEAHDVHFSFGIQSVISQNTVKSILSFAEEESADRVLLKKSDQSLISTLFLSSTTKEIIEKSIFPLLFITN